MKSPTRSSLLFQRVFGSSTRVLATPSRLVITTAPVFTLGSQAVTPNSQFACVTDHQNLQPGSGSATGKKTAAGTVEYFKSQWVAAGCVLDAMWLGSCQSWLSTVWNCISGRYLGRVLLVVFKEFW